MFIIMNVIVYLMPTCQYYQEKTLEVLVHYIFLLQLFIHPHDSFTLELYVYCPKNKGLALAVTE